MLLQEDAKEHKYVVKSQHFSNYTKQFSRKEFVPSKLLAGYPCVQYKQKPSFSKT